mgnify:CR=1 FL=1|tara:strand:- start:62027 stop:62638 length:612 start_codon:yes stop_codon:yes gene_type:complete
MVANTTLRSLCLCVASIVLLSASEGAAEPIAKTEVITGYGFSIDQSVKGDEGGGFAISGGLLWGVGADWVLGPVVQVAPNVFGGSNTHAGMAIGNAGHGDRFWQGLLEAGVHHRSGIGQSIFTRSDAKDTDLPYIGATSRLVIDIFEPGGLRFDLRVSGRRDVGSDKQEARTESCFLGCTSERTTFESGGWHISGGIGLSYQL